MQKKIILTRKKVKHIAILANLNITNKEVIVYQKQLSTILTYFEKLKKINTSKIKPTNQVTGLKNIYFQDGQAPIQTISQEAALSQAKKKHNGYAIAAAVIEKK